jgi:hypothetical protein
MTLYLGIGVLSAAGSIYVSKALLTPKLEQIVFALFLVAIAGFYLAFTAYFGNDGAWRLESEAVVVFAVIGLVGVRAPIALIIGYPMHGIWDVLHEVQAHGGGDVFGTAESTAIPLAYGVFCATYDLCMGAIFLYATPPMACGLGASWLTPKPDTGLFILLP